MWWRCPASRRPGATGPAISTPVVTGCASSGRSSPNGSGRSSDSIPRVMNVVLVTSSFRPAIGGLETHVAMLADGLADLGHGVEVLTQAGGGGRPGLELAGRGYLVRRFPAWPRGPHYRISPGLTRHVRRLDGVNVVHTFNYHALTALAGTMTSPVPVVFTPF